jgi:hypothetical protein
MLDSRLRYAFIPTILIALLSCGKTDPVSGTFVSHGDRDAMMLQLSQSENGQILGTYSYVQLNGLNSVKSGQTKVTGAVNAGEITLSFGGLLGVSDTRSGTANRDTIRLQTLGEHGEVFNSTFQRSSAEEFGRLSDGLRRREKTADLTAHLDTRLREVQNIIGGVDAWIAEANLHAARIPAVEDTYRHINDRMRELINLEQRTPNPVQRGQLSVQVSQVHVSASQYDLQGEAVWSGVMDRAKAINVGLNTFIADCATPDAKLQQAGIGPNELRKWRDQCSDARNAQTRFAKVFTGMVDQSMNVKYYREQHRKERDALGSHWVLTRSRHLRAMPDQRVWPAVM